VLRILGTAARDIAALAGTSTLAGTLLAIGCDHNQPSLFFKNRELRRM
jgi:hypothetical protein